MAKPYKSIRFNSTGNRANKGNGNYQYVNWSCIYDSSREYCTLFYFYFIFKRSPICFTRKVNSKLLKDKHTTTTYRSYKHFDENKFISDIANDLDEFAADKSSIDEDLNVWYSFLLKHLNNHAPIKSKRVKSKRMPDWFTPDIIQMQSLRDKTKRLKQWSDHRKYRNKTKQLIRQAKRKYFSNSITNSKDTKSLWKHLRDVTNGSKTASSNLPQKLIIGNETFTESEAVASKLNKYFASVAELLNKNTSSGNSLDFDTNKISDFVDSKVPTNTQFTIPFIPPNKFYYILIP